MHHKFAMAYTAIEKQVELFYIYSQESKMFPQG